MNFDLNDLNPMQRKAAETLDGPVLILAGAGSGKTRTVTYRIANLLSRGVAPWSILALTFTNKAAREMRERVEKLVGEGQAKDMWLGTFHSVCVRMLRRDIEKIGYSRSFTIYDEDDSTRVIKEALKTLDIDEKQLAPREVRSKLSDAKNKLMTPDEWFAASPKDFHSQKLHDVFVWYEQRLKGANALDFDDILLRALQLLVDHPPVLDYYRQKFRYVHVDEYQDTNAAQYQFVRLLTQESRNLCVVGDDDQSIYKFRGANIRNILDFEKYFPEAKVIKLEQNYRSTQSILDAANAVISNNERRKDKALWTERGNGELVHFRQFDNAYEEAEYIADDVCRKVRKQGAQYKDFAVLYRTNAQARLLEERMIMEGVPYNVVGGTNFYARAEIKDILAYLKTIDNGRDDVAVRRIINIPKRGIGAVSVEKIEDYAQMRDISLYDAMELADEIMSLGKTAAKIRPFVQLIRELRKASSELTIAELIQEIVEKIQYAQYLQDNDDESAEDRIANVDELITKAVAYQEMHDEANLTEFLAEVALVADIDKVEDDDNRVLLMTLHSAKGLEFPNVYLAGMEDGLFPGQSAIWTNDQEDIEEERRLAYVGITRAMNDLTLTCARSRMIRGETQYNPVSRFVREIPEELLDNKLAEPKRARQDRDILADIIGFGAKDTGTKPGSYDFRPKATLRPKVTAKADKPFIAKDIGSLNQLAGLSKGTAGMTASAPDYQIGDRVSHIKYGEGTVLGLVKEPRDYKVTVNFDNAGQKIMYASFAKLKRI